MLSRQLMYLGTVKKESREGDKKPVVKQIPDELMTVRLNILKQLQSLLAVLQDSHQQLLTREPPPSSDVIAASMNGIQVTLNKIGSLNESLQTML